MSAAERMARSRAAFAARFPEVMAALDQATPQSSILFDGDAPADIVFGEQRIYGGDARRLTAEQVESYIKKPLRLIMETPDAAGLVSEICISLKLAMERTYADSGVTEMSRGPISAPTFLVVFGVGLGYHLDELIRATGARWIIIVEPFLEFIGHSFHAIDWGRTLDRVEQAGGAVHILTDLDPGQMLVGIMGRISAHGIPYLDGTWAFTHYPMWAFAEAQKRLHGVAEFAYVNRGFFEDEIVMMTNAVTNFATHSFWLLDGKPRLHRPETAVIVGAGPSLDEAVETLHRIRDHVVLFSAGTGLRPLLRHGLLPDFHCELENGPHIYDIIAEAAKHGDLAKVRLVASATVDARVATLFGEKIFFYRDTVSSTRILRGSAFPLSNSAPTCVNTALSAASAFGFTDFVLFGADCGVRPGTPDHAEGTIYHDIDHWKERQQRVTYPLEVEGNFGGIAMTNWVYDASRRMLSDLISVLRLKVINCSDGALINGATPRVPEALEIDAPVVDPRRILADLERSMTRYAPSEILRDRKLPGLRRQSREMYADLREVVAGFEGGEPDFAGVFEALMTFTRQHGGDYGGAFAIPEGSISALPRIAMYYGCRTEDPALRARLFKSFMAELTKALDIMERETDALLERLGALAEKAPAAAE